MAAPCSLPDVARAGHVSAPDAAGALLIGALDDALADTELVLAGPERVGPVGEDFPREARLLDARAYAPVFKNNRRVADRFWTVLVHDSTDGHARLGLAIAKKRAKRAVDRNRLKRIARDSFRHHRSALGSRRLVIMNRDAATAASRAELRVGLDRLWQRIIAGKAGR